MSYYRLDITGSRKDNSIPTCNLGELYATNVVIWNVSIPESKVLILA